MSVHTDLYQEVLIDHSKHPRNFRKMENANHHAEGYNPLCGDKVEVFLSVKNHKVEDISFLGEGCAICTASASLLTEVVRGKDTDKIEAIAQDFRKALTSGNGDLEHLGKLQALLGVKQYPMRVKCATLAWHTLQSALKNKMQTVSTE